MRKLSFLIILSLSVFQLMGQSPHGDDFEMDCAKCHSEESWELLQKEMSFFHSETGFDLKGQHQFVDCRSCHTNLNFAAAKDECVSCHLDMHQNSVGTDCERCHTPNSWIVKNPIQMHRQTRFPLIGAHATADCFSCHEDASSLQFEPLSVECVDCHQADYLATTSPNHQESGYSTDCLECHGVRSVGWSSANFEHDFFPLTGGHSISCTQCHTSGTFGKIASDCISCHQSDYNSTTSPNHQQQNFSNDCAECHKLNPGWKPATFDHDNQYFPIYSGRHRNEWNDCADCHTNAGNYSVFSCITCHEHSQSNTDGRHNEVRNYVYNGVSCFECHPSGRAEDD
ncbi:hypothetical protein ACUNWD_00640 [Sunxiuqinia sp. A32]|uniref:hypothetical protein n=1 Tax=Sunxiuqinia sp. A32 TaxID=3461496 RepID=UPI0040453315